MTITVHCPECSKSFPVDPAKIPEGGVKVRCSACAAVFRVEEPEETTQAEAPEPGMVEAPEPDTAGLAEPEAETPVEESFAEPEAGLAEPEAETPVEESFTEPGAGLAAPAPEEEPPAEEPTAEPPPPEAPAAEAEEEAVAETEEAAVEAWWSTGAETVEEPAEESAGAEATTADVDSPDDWVIETEPDLDPSTLDVEPMETVETSQAGEITSAPTEGLEGAMPLPPLEEEEVEEDIEEEVEEATEAGAPLPGMGVEGAGAGSVVAEPGQEETLEVEPEPDEGMAPESVPAPTTSPTGFQFGKRDPEEKAKRLARVLVSDMIMYNPERHRRALEAGTLKQDFKEEIEKSWQEYVDQVGEETAHSSDYFSQALNDILAKGDEVFEGSPPS